MSSAGIVVGRLLILKGLVRCVGILMIKDVFHAVLDKPVDYYTRQEVREEFIWFSTKLPVGDEHIKLRRYRIVWLEKARVIYRWVTDKDSDYCVRGYKFKPVAWEDDD